MKLDCTDRWYCPYTAETVGYKRHGVMLVAEQRLVPRRWNPIYWVLVCKRNLRMAVAALSAAIGAVVLGRRLRK